MRYIIGFFITIGLIILLIALLVGGGGNKSKVPKTSKPLPSYATTDASVRMTIDGPVNAQQIHQQIRITVNKDEAIYEQIQGYDNHVVNTQSYANTETAYDNFLEALSKAGFTQGSNAKALQSEQGYCPLGNRFIFELIQNNQDIERYWTSSCGKPKSYLGNQNLTISLFKAQIPDYSKLTSSIENFQL